MKTTRFLAFFLCLVLLLSWIPARPASLAESKTSVSAVDKAVKPKSIKISGSRYVAKGKRITLKAAVSPAKASQEVIWTSGNEKIATVSSKGVVKGKKTGTVVITAVSKADQNVTGTWKLTVKAKAVSSVSISGVRDLNLKTKKKITLTAKAKPSAAAQSFEWKSSNKKVATVSSKGVVKAVAPGTVKITATATDGSNKKKTVTIRVTDGNPAPEIRRGWWEANGNTYYYDDDGNMVTGWYRIDHNWYFFRPNGTRLNGDPSIPQEAILYSDAASGLTLWNYQFNTDGTYNLFYAFFDRAFGHDDENNHWVYTPVSIEVEGTVYSVTWLYIQLSKDHTAEITISVNSTYPSFKATWTKPGDDVILKVGTKEWVLKQDKNTFTIQIGGAVYSIDHSVGNG